MHKFITTKQFFKYLLFLWMVVATHLLAVQPSRLIEKQTEFAIETESELREIDLVYFDTKLQSTNKHDIVSLQSWPNLKLYVFVAPVMTEPLYELWPVHSRINSYYTIISYQYFISSLDNFSWNNWFTPCVDRFNYYGEL